MDGVRLGCVPGGSGRPAGGVKKGDHMMSSMASPRKIQAVLIDLSGTLHVEDAAVGGSVGALKKLRSTGVKVKFVTNTTKESKRKLYERLRKIGFDIQPEELFTSLTAALHYVQTHQLRPLLLLEESAKEDFIGISQDKPNAVVIGLAPSCFNYEQMNQAFRLIMGGAQLIAIHKARYVKKADGLSLGPGPCVRVLEYSTDSKAVVLGKPEKKFFLSALQELACEPSNAVMIGDDVRDDVSGAQELGLLGILVKTGKYQAGDESKISPAPHQVVESFPEAVQYIVQHLLL